MRSVPWRTIVDSDVPRLLTRRLIVSIEAAAAFEMRARSPASVGLTMIVPSSLPGADVDVVASRSQHGVAERLPDLVQLLDRRVTVLGLGELDDELRSLNADTGNPDLGVAQNLARFIAQVVHPVLLDLVLVHGEQADGRRPGDRDPSGNCFFGMNDGHEATVSFEKKFGSATIKPARQISRMVTIFKRVKCSIGTGSRGFGEAGSAITHRAPYAHSRT